ARAGALRRCGCDVGRWEGSPIVRNWAQKRRMSNAAAAQSPSRKIRNGLCMRRRRRPTLPPPYEGSTIGADRLNDRVRDGHGCGPVALVASKNKRRVRAFVVVRNHSELLTAE